MTHFHTYRRVALAALVVFGVVAACLRADAQPPHAPPDTMGVDGLARGMTGYGLTVFQGTKIDTFDVEILGVLRNVFGPESDIVLARLRGDMLEKTNGIAGMSGSPVYVGGKMIGAVAYGWQFSKEPIMGITPIGEMLAILDRPTQDTAELPDRRTGHLAAVERASSRTLEGARSVYPGELRPATNPVYLSGFAPEVVGDLREALAPLGLLPVQGGGGVDLTLPEGELVPGAALGVQLVRGDLSMTAIGTLTYVDGKRLLGFGHPMLFSGPTTLPMTSAYIHEVIPNQLQSFKLGAASRTIGAITQDRAPGIGGVLGQTVEMVPTTIVVRSAGNVRTYEMEVLPDRSLGPVLMQSAVVSSLISAEKSNGESTVRTRAEFRLRGHTDPVVIENVYSGSRGLGEGVLGVTRPLQVLMQNPYERVHLESVRFDLDVASDVQAARIEGVRLDRDTFRPGDRIEVTVLLQPYLGEIREVRKTLRIPRQIEDGRLTLLVSSARDHASSDSKRAPGEYTLESLAHLLRRLRELDRNDEIIFEFLSQKPGVTVGGREVSVLPPSVQSALRLGRTSGSVTPVAQAVLLSENVRTNVVVSGSQTVFLNVGAEGPGLQFGGGASRPGAGGSNKQ